MFIIKVDQTSLVLHKNNIKSGYAGLLLGGESTKILFTNINRPQPDKATYQVSNTFINNCGIQFY